MPAQLGPRRLEKSNRRLAVPVVAVIRSTPARYAMSVGELQRV